MTTQDNIFGIGGGADAYNLMPSNHQQSPQRALMVTLADGTCIIESYMDIARCECDPTGKFMTFHIKGGATITFIGERLNKLMESLQGGYIKHLYCYDEDKHMLSNSEENPPIIKQIGENLTGEAPSP